MIQDYIMTSIFILFAICFYPQIRDCRNGLKINLFCAAITAAGLSIVGVCLFTLGIYFSAFLEWFVAFEWGLCLYYSWRIK
jgi:hypothetical protein